MNPLKTRLAKKGAFETAAWVELGNPDIAEILVRHGWKLLVIDGEHGTGGLEDWVRVARAIEAAGGEAILRVPDSSDTVLKKVLDRGFRSLIVPMVNSAGQARAIVRSCRYPPLGGRGYAAPIVRASGFGSRPDYARKEAHDELLLLVQCETPEAVAAMAEIAAVEGIDGIFLGPNDLSAMLGHLERMTETEPQSAFARVEAIAAETGILLATVTGGGRNWVDLKKRGFRLVVGPNDVSLLIGAAREAFRTLQVEIQDD